MARKRPETRRRRSGPAPASPTPSGGETPPSGSAPAGGPPRDGAAGPDRRSILEDRGEVEQNLIEIAARDMDRTAEDEKTLARERERKPGTFYSDLLYTLANIRYPEDEARLVWINLLTHKAEMSQLMGRNVGIRVAALDFFRNVLGNLGDVKIVDSSEYIETAKLAVTDGLTGIHNHRYFQDSLARALERAAHEREPVSVIMLDIDHFKLYNDRFGHIAGDVALREVAGALKSAFRKGAVVARYGGEEFAAILFAVGKQGALEEAERARAAVEALAVAGPADAGGRSSAPSQTALTAGGVRAAEGPDLRRTFVRTFSDGIDGGAKGGPSSAPSQTALTAGGGLTISLGVATFPEDASDRNGLIEWADLSLYLAKTGGRNRAVSCPVDRRRVNRYHAELDVRLRPRDAPEEPFRRFSVVDIGSGGVALVGEGLPSSGSPVAVLLSGGGLREPLATEARVAWRRSESRLGELAGVEFVNLPAESARTLARWLAHPDGG